MKLYNIETKQWANIELNYHYSNGSREDCSDDLVYGSFLNEFPVINGYGIVVDNRTMESIISYWNREIELFHDGEETDNLGSIEDDPDSDWSFDITYTDGNVRLVPKSEYADDWFGSADPDYIDSVMAGETDFTDEVIFLVKQGYFDSNMEKALKTLEEV